MNSGIYFTNRKEWRSWLEENHQKEQEIWLIYYKKHTGVPRIPYDDAVEEALCFGWIDSLVKRIDDEKFMQKFSPRNDKSAWSESNKKRVSQLLEKGLMAEAGIRKIEAARKNGSWDRVITSVRNHEMPIELEQALAGNKAARKFFESLTPSCQKQYVGWVASAKKAETRTKRAEEALARLNKKEKLGLK